MSQDQNTKDIGNLIGTLTTFVQEVRDHRQVTLEKIDQLQACVQSQSTKMDVRFKAIEKELSLYAFIYKFVKVVGLILAAILTFKFGDITNIWQKVFKP